MKKVIDIKELPLEDDTRKKYEIVILNNDERNVKEIYIDQSEMLEYIKSFLDFLNSEKDRIYDENRNQLVEARRKQNMKYIWLYTVAFVGLVLSFVTTIPIGVPVFLAFFVAGIIIAIVVNVNFNKKNVPIGAEEIISRIDEISKLEKIAIEANKNSYKNKEEQTNSDNNIIKQEIELVKDDFNAKQLQMKASFWQYAKKNLKRHFEKIS